MSVLKQTRSATTGLPIWLEEEVSPGAVRRWAVAVVVPGGGGTVARAYYATTADAERFFTKLTTTRRD